MRGSLHYDLDLVGPHGGLVAGPELGAQIGQELAEAADEVVQAVPIRRLEAEGQGRLGDALADQGPAAGHFDANAVQRRLRMLRPGLADLLDHARPPSPLTARRRSGVMKAVGQARRNSAIVRPDSPR